MEKTLRIMRGKNVIKNLTTSKDDNGIVRVNESPFNSIPFFTNDIEGAGYVISRRINENPPSEEYEGARVEIIEKPSQKYVGWF